MSTRNHPFDVLVVDDEIQIRRLLKRVLKEEGYVVREAENGEQALQEVARGDPALMILDLGLPDRSGLSVLEEVRQKHAIPVLILSVFGQEENKIRCLDAGADDYLVKPFSENELLARLRALLRRVKPVVATNIFRFGRVEVDVTHRQVLKDGEPLRLTSMEYALLELFIAHRDKILTHRQILRELWGEKAEDQTHYLRTYMLRLRRKLEDDLCNPRHFQTESGVGYRFVGDSHARD